VATAKFGGFLPLNRLQKTFGRRLSLIPRPNAPSLTLIKWLTEVGAAPADGIGNQRGQEHNRLPGNPAMISTTDPDSMTTEERRLEIASILARGVLRRIRLGKTAASPPSERISKSSKTGLEVSSRTRLSVAPRPAG
jgi:hypothetical protein